MTLGTRLIEQTRGAWLLMIGEHPPHAQGWRIRVVAPPEPAPVRAESMSDDEHQTQCTAMKSRAMEHVIAQFPSQCLWDCQRDKQPKRMS